MDLTRARGVRDVVRFGIGCGQAAVALTGLAVSWPAGFVATDRAEARGLPVVCAAGFGATKSTWWRLTRRLTGRRFVVEGVHFNPTRSIPELAGQLAERAEALMARTGVDRVALVGHSMGGLVARWAACHDLRGRVPLVVTVGSPHRGTPAAWLGAGLDLVLGPGAAADMRPGSAVVRALAAAPGAPDCAWVALYSPFDELVPSGSARLPDDGTLAGPVTNVVVPAIGHALLVWDPRCVDHVHRALEDAVARVLH